jgi:hypothetical protein
MVLPYSVVASGINSALFPCELNVIRLFCKLKLFFLPFFVLPRFWIKSRVPKAQSYSYSGERAGERKGKRERERERERERAREILIHKYFTIIQFPPKSLTLS